MSTFKELKLEDVSALFTEEILRESVRKTCLLKYGKEVDKIVNYTLSYASGKGDGYLGVIYRVCVQCEDGIIIKVIGKGMPESLQRRETFKCLQHFKKEVQFFNEIVPVFREFEKKAQVKTSCLQIPECYYAISDGVNDFLVLEDLNDSGYSMASKATGLDQIQTISMFEMLGRLHGISLAMKYKDPDQFEKLVNVIEEPIFRPEMRSWIENYFLNLGKKIIEAVKEELQDTEYLRKFQSFVDPAIYFDDMTKRIMDRGTKYVIGHGDAWATNFMFDNERAACKALDFQLLRVSSPMIDVSTVIFSCLNAEQRDKYGGVPGILSVYQKAIHTTVTSLGAPASAGLSKEELEAMWHSHGAHGLGHAVELVPLSLVDSEDVAEMDQVVGEEPTRIEDLTSFLEIKSEHGKQRLVDMIKLAVDQALI